MAKNHARFKSAANGVDILDVHSSSMDADGVDPVLDVVF